MAEQVIKPDLDFVKGVIAAGGESLKKCYQCAACSVVCNVTPDDKPFPRKEMIWAQWGLKDKFKGNPDIWLCHQCNDCTVYCPRGAKPAEVLGAIRKQSIQQYSVPGFMSGFVNNKLFLPILFLLPAIILLAVSGFGIPEGETIKFTNLFSVFAIQLTFTPALIFGFAIGILGLMKFWKDMSQTRLSEKQAGGVTSGSLGSSIGATVKEILGHSRFKDCTVSKDRYLAHLLVFYGFVLLGIATAIGVLYIDILHDESPFPLVHPVKFFGNIGAIALLPGVFLMIINRFKNAAKIGIGSYFDWLLLFIIAVIVSSGILAEVTRLADFASLAYPIYFIHLVFVFSLFIYLPYSKLAHMFYRATAICYSKYSGRDKEQLTISNYQ